MTKVTLIDSMGNDLTVVNAARVSFNKESHWEHYVPSQGIYELSDKDKKLIKYLAKHQHWTPFGHCFLSFRLHIPIFVARQLVKHQVGLCLNEVSRRYIDETPEFYEPESWRSRPTDSKQGSGDETISWLTRNERVGTSIRKIYEESLKVYGKMIEANIAPEQARMILPQSTMTTWIWSGSLAAFARVCSLRCKGDTQEETRNVAWEIHDLAREKFPVSWESLFYSKL
jgi:thymidylate synthase (FAD)